MKRSRTTNSFINLAAGFGGQLFSTVMQFVVRTVFIYTLGKSYLGINGLFTNILSVLSLAELGIGSAIVYRLYRPLASGDEKRVRILVKFYKLAYRVIGVVILALGLLMIPFLPVLIKDYETLEALNINAVLLFLLFLTKSVASYLFLAYRSTVVSADQKKYIVDIIRLAVNFVTEIAQIILLLLFKNFILYSVVGVGSAIVTSLLTGVIARRMYPNMFLPEQESLSKTEIKEMFQDCGALFVYKVNTVVVKASDNLVLSAFVGIAAVGLYSNYMLLYRTCVMLLEKVFVAFKASMGNLFATESLDVRYRFFRITNLMTALLFGTAGVGVAVCANEVIEVWLGSAYLLAQPIPILVGIELFFSGIIVNLGQVRSVSGVFRQAWYRPLIGIVVNIVVSIALVHVWGTAGVIMGTIASYVLTNFLIEPALIYKYTFKNARKVSEYYKDNFTYLFVCVVVAAADLWLCTHILVGHGWLSVAVHVLITGLSVPAVFALLYWRTEEGQYLMGTATRSFQRVSKKLRKK